MLFLFVEHPYDIGDWVEVDGKSYEVVKISLMNTTFHASGKIRAVIPNASLIPKVTAPQPLVEQQRMSGLKGADTRWSACRR